MTEIPEHLLKRSKAAKAKADGAEAPADAPAAVPATTAAAAPAAAPRAAAPVESAPVVKPDTPVVAAYKARKKIPVWAMLTLSILPVWAFMYLRALTPGEVEASGPLGDGTAAWATNCSGCHGADGGGVGSAYQLSGGDVWMTFPHIEDQLRWVLFGTKNYLDAGIQVYGDPNRQGGPHITGASGGQMPGWKGAITDAEILAAVCHTRYDLNDVERAEEFDLWCSPESEIYAALEEGTATLATVHEAFADKGVLLIGDAPAEGTSAG